MANQVLLLDKYDTCVITFELKIKYNIPDVIMQWQGFFVSVSQPFLPWGPPCTDKAFLNHLEKNVYGSPFVVYFDQLSGAART